MDASKDKKIYSFDAGALILLEVFYPARLFPKVWERLDILISEKRLYVLDKVYDEVTKKDDTVSAWLKARRIELKKRFSDKQMEKVFEIIRTFPKLIDYNNKNEQADPYLVADAISSGSVIVTTEKNPNLPLQAKRKKESIATVCDHYSVTYINNNAVHQNHYAMRLFDELGLTQLG